MNELIDTGTRDKAGKPINVDDIIHTQLGSFAKSKGKGPRRTRVIKFGKHFDLVAESSTHNPYGGSRLTEQIARHRATRHSVICYNIVHGRYQKSTRHN